MRVSDLDHVIIHIDDWDAGHQFYAGQRPPWRSRASGAAGVRWLGGVGGVGVVAVALSRARTTGTRDDAPASGLGAGDQGVAIPAGVGGLAVLATDFAADL